MEFLQVEEVFKEQKQSTTLHPVSFAVEQGKKIGVAGATGSGKSTLLKIIAGLVQPTGGQALLEGKRILGPDEKLLPGHPHIGYLSQHFELRNNYTIGEELEYANLLPPSEAEAIYKICDVAHLLARGTNEVSGGEKQRVVTARVLTTRPRLLLLDEPYSNLDPGHRATMKGIIRHVSELMGITCLLVSHDPLDTLSWADEIIVLQAGRMVQQASPQTIFYQSVNEYVAGLFGPYSLLSPAQAAVFGIPAPAPHKKLLVRPGSIKAMPPNSGGVEATILDQAFLGSHFELTLGLPQFQLTMLTQDEGMKAETKIFVGLRKEQTSWL